MVLAMTVAISVSASALNAQMIAGWQFEEGTGTVANDALGYGIQLNLYGDTTWDSDVPEVLAGKSFRSVKFDGDGDYGEAPPFADRYMNPYSDLRPGHSGAWTIMCWVKTNQWVNNGTFMDKMNTYRIAEYGSGVEVMNRTVPQANEYASGGFLNDSAWHHVAGTYDGSTYMRAYVDGALVATNNTGGPGVETHAVFRIGGGSISWGSFFNGKMDEAAVFLEMLDLAEIQSLMENGIASWVDWPNLEPYMDGGPFYTVSIPDPRPAPHGYTHPANWN